MYLLQQLTQIEILSTAVERLRVDAGDFTLSKLQDRLSGLFFFFLMVFQPLPERHYFSFWLCHVAPP